MYYHFLSQRILSGKKKDVNLSIIHIRVSPFYRTGKPFRYLDFRIIFSILTEFNERKNMISFLCSI